MGAFIVTLICLFAFQEGACHPLEDYVYTPDPAYSYFEIVNYPFADRVIHVLNMTSQHWYDESVSSHHIWTHQLTIIRPTTPIIPTHAFLFVGIGNSDTPVPTPDGLFLQHLSNFTKDTGAVSVMISQIPNQPITFPDDPKEWNRTEDDLIAFTWTKFLNDSARDPNINLYFPMVKAVVRAMDTVEEFCQQQDARLTVNNFMIGGPSKRGWTTYLTGGIDKRVFGLVPMVITISNMHETMHHHFRSLGGWAYTFKPYYDERLTEYLDFPEAEEIMAMCDPHIFNDNYTMPKLQIKAGGDEFFMLDDTQFFFSGMPGIKYMWTIPNTNHYLVGWYNEILYNIVSFFTHVYYNYEWPQFTYQLNSDAQGGEILVQVQSGILLNITAWHSYTIDGPRRDFRWAIANPNNTEDYVFRIIPWDEIAVEDNGDSTYRLYMDSPSEGYVGFFVELNFETPTGRILRLTTEPLVAPNTFGFSDCQGKECLGSIV